MALIASPDGQDTKVQHAWHASAAHSSLKQHFAADWQTLKPLPKQLHQQVLPHARVVCSVLGRAP